MTTTNQPKLTNEELEKIKHNPAIRRELARKSHYWFFVLYLGSYFTLPFASFHHEMFAITENNDTALNIIVAFRGSGKSTLLTLSYPIWAIIGEQQRKFILIVSQTQYQAKLHLANIKRELENNLILKEDIGPFQEISDEWGANSIVIPKFDARITAVSTEQSIRGLRHGPHRPDLIICDDIEDLNSVKTKEGRERTSSWYNGEIVPIGDKKTKTLIVGNLLHEDCLILQLKDLIDQKKFSGKFYAFPLITKDKQIAWPSKYPSFDDIERLRKSFALDSAFCREYLLVIISDFDRVVHPEWIHYYDELPSCDREDFQYAATGIDLAISESAAADYTAMVSAYTFGGEETLKIYILPGPINRRMGFPEAVETAISVSRSVGHGNYSKLFIESVGYQDAFIQHLVSKNVPAEGVKVYGQDKRARLALITHLIQQGVILFPRQGAEELIRQLTGFGVEKHDDLADAFSLLLNKIMGIESQPEPQMIILETLPDGNSRLSSSDDKIID